MASLITSIILIIASFFVLASAKKHITRSNFPKGFIFGTSSAAYQYEGAANEGGRGPSIWDTFSNIKGNILGNANGNVAVDQYHRYEKDISFMADMGMDAYRLSISWSRLYPEGKGELNEVGINYYNNLINGLLAKGIQPYVTIYHYDLPQKLEDSYGGWLSSKIVDDYENFANTCFKYFGDRVKHWITFNEPSLFILYGFDDGENPPSRCSLWKGCKSGNSSIEPYIVQKNVIIAHATAVAIYRKNYQTQQKGKIGITLNSEWYEALTNSTEDANTVPRILDFYLGWHLNPLLHGEYPTSMKELVGDRLPTFTNKEKEMLKNSLDFLGINYYTTFYTYNVDSHPDPSNSSFYLDARAGTSFVRDGVPIGPQAGSVWLHICPKGIYDLLKYIKTTYPTVPPIVITENGIDEANNASLTLHQSLKDPIRIKSYNDHLHYLARAIREGVDVRGFFAWSLLDNFQWTAGFTSRFGVHFVDFLTLERYPKESARWFKMILKKRH